MVSADGQIEFSLFLSVGFQVLTRPTPFKGLVNRLSSEGILLRVGIARCMELPFVVT